MKQELHILMIEDIADDAELVEQELRKAGLKCHLTRVATKGDFLRELHRRAPDVILSDHGLPAFDGLTALAIARMQCPDTPFLFVTGSQGNEVAIQTLESGATDFVTKDCLGNLAPAIRRALREAEHRSRCRQAQGELERLAEELRVALSKVEAMKALLLWP